MPRPLRSLVCAALLGVALVAAGLPLQASPASAAVIYGTSPLAGWSTNGVVRTVLVEGDTVYLGGSFTELRGPGGTPVVPRTNLAAIDRRTGALVTGFRADANGVVRALASDGTSLFVGGSFTTIGGLNRGRVAKLGLTTGAVSGWRADVSSHVYALARHGDRLYVGGAFGTAAGQARSRVAALDTNTAALDPAFAPAAGDTVHALAVSPDGRTVYVGGNFTTMGGLPRPYLAGVSAEGTVLPVTFQHLEYRVIDLAVSPDGASVFAAQGGFGNQATAYAARTGQRLWFQPADGDVQAVHYSAGHLYFGFHEGALGDGTVRVLAADAVTGALDPAFRPTVDSFYGVWDIASSRDALVLGGEFRQVAGVATRGVTIFPNRFGPDVAPPSVPSGLVATATASAASLTWTPSSDDTLVEGYHVLRDGVPVGFTTQTTFTDAGVADGATYRYAVQAMDIAGNRSALSAEVEVATPRALVRAGASWRYLALTTPPADWAERTFDDSAWPLGAAELGYGDGDEATVVPFGPDAAAKPITTWFRHTFTVADPARIAELVARILVDDGAIVRLNGTEVQRLNLPAGPVGPTTRALSSVEGAAERAVQTFSLDPRLLVAGQNVLAVEVHQAFSSSSDISLALELDGVAGTPLTAPTGLTATSVSPTIIALAWDPVDGAAAYRVRRDGAVVTDVPGPGLVDEGLADATAYEYTVAAVDGVGRESPPSGALRVTTPDATAPSVPTGLRRAVLGVGAVRVEWDAATDNVGVASYEVSADGSPVAAVAGTSLEQSGLPPGAVVVYSVVAVDAAGNRSAASAPLAVTVPDTMVDTTPPGPPGALTARATGSTGVALSWTPATDDIGVVDYVVRRDGVVVATVVGTTAVDTGLTPATSYGYEVVARDDAGNASVAATVTAATLPAITTLVAADATWRYRDTGVDPGPTWTSPAYDDAGWTTGRGQFGYGDGDETTVVSFGPDAARKHPATWFRTTFTLDDPATVQSLTLLLLRDDGAVVYLNGVEVARSNMPAGPIATTTRAVLNIEGTAERTFSSFTVPSSALVAGANTIAVSVHQQWAGSSDLSFQLRLDAAR